MSDQKVVIRIPVSKKLWGELAAAGIPTSTQNTVKVYERYASEAVAAGKDPYRFERVGGKGGLKIPDSGEQVFAFEGVSDEGLSLVHLAADLVEIGFGLAGYNLGEAKNRQYLYLKFVLGADSIEVPELANALLTATYGITYIWANPDGSYTVNPGARRSEAKLIRELRIDSNGNFVAES